jgi:hypothetical protein
MNQGARKHERTVTVATVAAWLGLWIAIFASGYGTDGFPLLVLLLMPQFVLGLATGRWWSALLPFILVALVPLEPNDPCQGIDCGEDFPDIPTWLVVAAFIAPVGAVSALAGTACRRLLPRLLRRDPGEPVG